MTLFSCTEEDRKYYFPIIASFVKANLKVSSYATLSAAAAAAAAGSRGSDHELQSVIPSVKF